MNTQHPEHESRLEKVRALLAKAEATQFPEEAKAFTAKAQELMAKWAIDDAMLAASQGKAGNIIEHTIWIDANEYRSPKIQLLVALCEVNDCKPIMYPQQYVDTSEGRKRRFKFNVIGHDSDCDTVETLYSSLLLQSTSAFLNPDVQMKMEIECEEAGHRIRWRNAFMLGFALEIRSLLLEIKRRVKAQAETQYAPGCTALVLADRKSLVERKFSELYPKVCKKAGSNAGQFAGSASGMGREAARRADLGRPKVGGSRKLIGG